MSRAAYENYFGKQAPPGAYFGTDVSWFQGAGDYGETLSYWRDFINWCSFANIRTSYGASGDDGNQQLHFQAANEVGFSGPKGTYHYVVPNSGLAGNFNNYISRSDPFVDQTGHDMLDFEEGPNPGAGFINQFRDMVEQRRQRNCFIYGGKGYLDAAGTLTCPIGKIWMAHYPGRSADAWNPTTDWNSNGAPLIPYQYGANHPGCWQWSSSAIGYSLDLDITTNLAAFGSNGEIDMPLSDDEARMLREIHWRTNATATGWHFPDGTDINTLPEFMYNLWMMIQSQLTGPIQATVNDTQNHVVNGVRAWQDQNKPTLDAIKTKVDSLSTGGTGNINVEQLASLIASQLGAKIADVDSIRALVREELSKLRLSFD